jgi:hypothetical protein
MLKLVLTHRNLLYMNLVNIIVEITKEDLSKDQKLICKWNLGKIKLWPG